MDYGDPIYLPEARVLTTSRKRRLYVGQAFGLVLLSVAGLSVADDLVPRGFGLVANAGTLAAIGCLYYLARLTQFGVWSGSHIFGLIFAIFHFGLTGGVAVGLNIDAEMGKSVEGWLYTPETTHAILLSIVGLAAFSSGVAISRALFVGGSVGESVRVSVVGRFGVVIVATAISFWFVFGFMALGPRMLLASYGEFLAATSGYPLPWVYLWISIGAVFLAVRAQVGRVGLIFIGLFVFAALPLGLRGEVMFPCAAAAAIVAKRRKMPRGWVVVVVVIAMLGIFAGIRTVRKDGLGRASLRDLVASPAAGLMELGASLRPVREVIRWQLQGEPYLYGASYWAPLDRALVYVIPGWTRVPMEQDDRLLNNVVAERVGNIGFSPVAEAYRNFGGWGVLAVMLLMGLVIGWTDTLAGTTGLLLQGVVMVPLLNHVRNSFVPVPAHMVAGIVMVIGVATLDAVMRRGLRIGRNPVVS